MPTVPTADIEFVKELYPRLREDDAAIERYRAAIDRLPSIVVAGRPNEDGSTHWVLVDGFHRWQAYRREGIEEIPAEDLGNLADTEILRESVRRNASHGRQLETRDKKRMADLLWRKGTRDEVELCDLLSITPTTCAEYLRDAKRDEKEAQKAKAWDLWLDCCSEREIGEALDLPQKTINRWLSESKANVLENDSPPESRQHFDVWSFQNADDDAGTGSYFGRMPPQAVENLLWLYTEPGHVVVDPFAGGGTTIDVAKRMGRRIWASDLTPSTPTLPIHEWDGITDGSWPPDGPRRADLVLLDPPYWQQAAGRYSDRDDDMGNMSLQEFYDAWYNTVKICADHTERIAYIISPTQLDDGTVVDHATDMLRPFRELGWRVERRIIVTYQTQQATGQQVEWAREHRRLLKLYRDLVVLTP